ncbi:hypothetical protein F3J29_09960 [Enterobacter sp. Cy-643]|uniref:hypothetical protein n=1 Tax=Enterobacter sp. Cy-643 TaxID=2608346 RepID=UPI0014202051|nr:hypothetical protein [Enterobacter sp. Cy-643]NIF32463.1 hypothetical protein [Enterobacter sp. Cy-643]
MLISNHPLKNVLSAVIGVTALFTSAGAFAAKVTAPQTATAAIVLNNPIIFTHSLTVKEDMMAGIDNGTLAEGNVTFSAGATEKVAYTFGEGTQQYSGFSGGIETLLTGSNNPENKLRVMLSSATDAISDWEFHAADSLIPYAYVTGPVTDDVSSYKVTIPGRADINNSKPDSYVLSVTAYGYTS